jgi:hypothetical protein
VSAIRVFLSHSSHDRRQAARIARFLDANGVEYFYSKHHILGAEQWHDELGTALRRCNRFALLLTPNAVRSRWVKHELVFALQAPEYRNRIAPLLFEPCSEKKLSWTLPNFQHIDFRRRFDEACVELLTTLQKRSRR